jgi:hypothetical protein
VTEIFESSLSIIILALIAGVRLVLYLRKRAGKQAANRMPPPLAGIEAIEAEGAVLAGDEDDEEFSAWNLSVEPRKPAPPQVPAPVRDTVFSPAVLPPVFPKAAPLPVSVPDPGPQSRPEETSPVVLAETRRSKKTGVFREKMGALPSLRQGVILSEILGPPKGL